MIFCRLYLPVLLGLFSVVLHTGHRENNFARQRSCAAARRGSISGMESGLRDLVRGDTGDGKGPLYNAAFGGHYEAVQWLLELKKRLALDRLFLGEDAALCAAAEGGHLEICCLLLEQGAWPLWESPATTTPLILAAENGHTHVVELLLRNLERHKCFFRQRGIFKLERWLRRKFDSHFTTHVEINCGVGGSALCRAAAKGHLDVVYALLRAGARVEGACNRRILHKAARKGYADIVALLLSFGAEVDAEGRRGRRALHEAARGGFRSVVQTLLTSGARVDATDWQGRTALHEAIQHGFQGVAEMLLDAGAAAHAVDAAGHTPSYYAVEAGSPSVVQRLIHAGADPNEVFPLAVKKGHSSLVSCLLNNGANPNAEVKSNKTALMYTAKNGLTSLVFHLLEAGASVRPIYCEDKAALTLAAERGFDDAVGLIANADREFIDLVDGSGRTALHYAIYHNHPAVIKRLLAAGANPNEGVYLLEAFNWRNGRPNVLRILLEGGAHADGPRGNGASLLRAAQHGRESLVQLLLAHGADPNALGGSDHETALHMAVKRRSLELVQVLSRAGADFTLGDEAGEATLEYALRKESYDIAQELISRGAQLSAARWRCDHCFHSCSCSEQTERFRCALQERYEALLSLLEQERGLPETVSELILKAFSGEDWAILKLFFGHGTNDGINIALHRAVRMGFVFLIKRLLLKGADANWIYARHLFERKRSPLDIVLSRGYNGAVCELASRGAFVPYDYSDRDREAYRKAFDIARCREQEVYSLLRGNKLSDKIAELVLSFALDVPQERGFYHADRTTSDDDDEKYSDEYLRTSSEEGNVA